MQISLFDCRMGLPDYSGSPYSGKYRFVSLFGQLFTLSLTYGVASNNEPFKIVLQQRKLAFIYEE
jgi:hypothetical protein